MWSEDSYLRKHHQSNECRLFSHSILIIVYLKHVAFERNHEKEYKELTETREAEKSSKRQKQQESAAKQQTLESSIEK